MNTVNQTTTTDKIRTYTLQVNEWELEVMTLAIECRLLEAEMESDMGSEVSALRANRLANLLNKLENIEPVEVTPAKADWPFKGE